MLDMQLVVVAVGGGILLDDDGDVEVGVEVVVGGGDHRLDGRKRKDEADGEVVDSERSDGKDE